MGAAKAVAALCCLCVDLQGEARVFMAELVGGVANVVAARAAQARIGAAEGMEGDVSYGCDPVLLELLVRRCYCRREHVASKVRRVVLVAARGCDHEVCRLRVVADQSMLVRVCGLH